MIDIHAHLHVKEFATDQDEVIQRAWDAGLSAMLNVGFDRPGNIAALELAKTHENIFATFGIHPHCANEYSEKLFAEYEKLIREYPEKIIAIGEMGLDFFKHATREAGRAAHSPERHLLQQPEDVQKKVFRAQLAFAREMNLPCIIHCRDAFEEALTLLHQEKIQRAVFHCFTGNLEIAEEIWKKGYRLSFAGIVTFPTATEIQEVACQATENQFFIETDCPYLAPVPMRGKRNEPAFLRHTLEFLAHLRKEDTQTLDKALTQSTQSYFNLPINMLK